MGMAGPRIESLFLAPEFHRRGGGRRLIDHARSLADKLTVDVNEQNTAAVAFYKACGFVVEGRSELDDTSRPYPLLHMRLEAAPNEPRLTRPQGDRPQRGVVKLVVQRGGAALSDNAGLRRSLARTGRRTGSTRLPRRLEGASLAVRGRHRDGLVRSGPRSAEGPARPPARRGARRRVASD